MDQNNQMNDQQARQLCETLLIETKGLADLYMHGALEAATPNVRTAMQDNLKDTLLMQQTIYDKMAEKGWYPSTQAPQDQITQTRQKFQNMQ